MEMMMMVVMRTMTAMMMMMMMGMRTTMSDRTLTQKADGKTKKVHTT
jgi:hypothetical protein